MGMAMSKTGGDGAGFGDNADTHGNVGSHGTPGGGGGGGIPPDDGSAVDDNGFVTIQGG